MVVSFNVFCCLLLDRDNNINRNNVQLFSQWLSVSMCFAVYCWTETTTLTKTMYSYFHNGCQFHCVFCSLLDRDNNINKNNVQLFSQWLSVSMCFAAYCWTVSQWLSVSMCFAAYCWTETTALTETMYSYFHNGCQFQCVLLLTVGQRQQH